MQVKRSSKVTLLIFLPTYSPPILIIIIGYTVIKGPIVQTAPKGDGSWFRLGSAVKNKL